MTTSEIKVKIKMATQINSLHRSQTLTWHSVTVLTPNIEIITQTNTKALRSE